MGGILLQCSQVSAKTTREREGGGGSLASETDSTKARVNPAQVKAKDFGAERESSEKFQSVDARPDVHYLRGLSLTDE